MSDPATLSAAILVAASAGVVHTLVGPDHYVPIVAVGKERGWSARRLVAATAALGLAHCLVSVVLVVVLVAFLGAVSPSWLDGLGQLAAWLLIASGAVFAVAAWRHRTAKPAAAVTLLAVAFLVGPCEWMIPVALGAGASHGIAGALVVSGVYTVCTVATMVAATAIASFGLRTVRSPSWFTPLACTACGVLMLLGL